MAPSDYHLFLQNYLNEKSQFTGRLKKTSRAVFFFA